MERFSASTDVSILDRRTLLRAAFGGMVAVGLAACGGGAGDSAVTEVARPGGGTATSNALGGESIEVWRDPG